MKAIVIGTSLSGKTTLINYLYTQSRLPLLEMDDELVRINDGSYPEDVQYKHNILAPQIIRDILSRKEIIFFTNTDYFTDKDLSAAKSNGFKIIQLEVKLDELKKRNAVRILKEGRDDWGKWLEGMIQYQNDIRQKGLVDKTIFADQSVDKIAYELITFLEE